MGHGGKRAGAGRPRTGGFVRDEVALRGHNRGYSRTSTYRYLRRGARLTDEAGAFSVSHGRFITGRALDIAGEFETAAEQIAALEFAIEQRKARRRLTLIETIRHVVASLYSEIV
jgi:uncharacterized glyoxalase superfamily metalloenzyme YdcJ